MSVVSWKGSPLVFLALQDPGFFDGEERGLFVRWFLLETFKIKEQIEIMKKQLLPILWSASPSLGLVRCWWTACDYCL